MRQTKLGYYGTIEKPAEPHYKSEVCCVVCGWPEDTAVHLPPAGAPPGTPPFDHAYIANASQSIIKRGGRHAKQAD
jgi:hypothetical protein